MNGQNKQDNRTIFKAEDREIVTTSDFFSLRDRIREVESEIDFINSKIIPKVRERLAPGSGLSLPLIFLATQQREVFPELEKRVLKYARFIGFNGRRCTIKREALEKAHSAISRDSSGNVTANGKRLPNHLPREVAEAILSDNNV